MRLVRISDTTRGGPNSCAQHLTATTKKNTRTTEVGKNRLPFGVSWIPQGLSAALLMGTFVLGVGTGVTVDSAINTNPKDLASRDAIDKNAPNPKFCQVGCALVVNIL